MVAVLVVLQLAAEPHVGALQTLGQKGSQAGEAHQHERHAHQGVQNGRQFAGGGARREAAMTCKQNLDQDRCNRLVCISAEYSGMASTQWLI